jgi:hypothetical protein
MVAESEMVFSFSTITGGTVSRNRRVAPFCAAPDGGRSTTLNRRPVHRQAFCSML